MTPEQIEAIYDDEEPNRARDLLVLEADRGNSVAQFYMGQLCAEESPRDDEGAVAWFKWLRLAADQGTKRHKNF